MQSIRQIQERGELLVIAVILVNALLVALVFGAILTLLAWGIRSDRVVATRLERRRRAVSRDRRRAAAPRFSPAYNRGS